ncbi:MAG TPA: BTAD domain-containing putative transcriptional regulator [Streptosporangiaceae bacterium]
MNPFSLRSPESGILLLGPVAVAADGQVTGVPQLSLRVLLATLAATNSVVPVATLIDSLWQEEHSQRRVRNLHTRVYELRRWLAGTMTESRAPRIVTQAPGYQLMVGAGDLDVTVFGQLAGQAREALRAGDYGGSAARYRRALALWRGPALADVAEAAPRLRDLAEQLEEQRLTVLTERIAADLAGGMDAELLGELTGLVQRYPFLERLRYQLMLSLYRCGRQADALAAFQDARRALREELGIDPGPELTELHQRILMADAGLTDRQAVRSPGPAVRPVPRQLPPTMTRFVGRTFELHALDRMLEQAEASRTALIVAITGGAGVGKSALALRWAHELSGRFPDGQLYVNLRGFGPSAAPPIRPMRAVRGFLDALDVPPGRVPASLEAQVALYRSLVADKRILVLLDNASQADQIRPLLPGGSGGVAVVTSRNDLLGLAATDDAWPLPLDVFSAAEAGELLRLRRPAEFADGACAATELIELCARLPLALAITLARADAHPGQSLTSLAGELRADSGRLDVLNAGEESASVRAAFSWSYRKLSEPAALLFRLLAKHHGPDIGVPEAASLADFPAERARAALSELTATGLLTESAYRRYSCHDLLRLYAAELRTQEPLTR